MRWKRVELAAAMLMACLTVYAAGVSLSQQRLSNGLVRLHVIANSDTVYDQQVKLLVRDQVLRTVQPHLTGAKTISEVRSRLSECLQEVADAAQDTLQAQGAPYSVSVQLAGEYYPTREYETFSLPAGTYVGLKVRLGTAAGKNWWCVVFPPLCTDAAQAPQNALSDQTTLRFKTAEWLGEMRARIFG